MTTRELFKQLEELGLADMPLVTNPLEPEQEDCWIEWEKVIDWTQTEWGSIFLKTEH